jgi:hypothetical protein
VTLTKRTVALSYVFVFAVGMIFAESMQSNHPARGLLWLTILLVILSGQLEPRWPQFRKSLIVAQSLLCAAAMALLVLVFRG